MQQIRGPAIFLAQFMADNAPYNSLDSLCQWAADKGFKGIQLPTDPKLFDLEQAASSQHYCDSITQVVASHGLTITELSTHLQGQLVAVHPAYDAMFDSFAPPQYRDNPAERTQWAISQLKHAAIASQRLGLKAHATFSGALLWQTIYPWPQRPAG